MLALPHNARREASMSDLEPTRHDAHTLQDLAPLFRTTPDAPNRALLIGSPGFKVLHLCLCPGQSMPEHDHIGCYVTIQTLAGTATVVLDGRRVEVPAGSLLSFDGESRVSPGNAGPDDCAVLITLVDRPA